MEFWKKTRYREHPNDKRYRAHKEYAGFRNGILSLLVKKDQSCHALGHDVIYAYYMLAALSRSEVPATVELYNAMTKLLEGFAASGPGYTGSRHSRTADTAIIINTRTVT